MRILDRYILKSVLTLFISCLTIFLFLYVIIDLFSHLDEMLRDKVSIFILAQYYLSYLPIIFVEVSPIACLLATLYTFGRLNRNNEIIAMRSSGLSIFQISKTAIMLGIVVSILVFFVNNRYVPQSLSETEKVKSQIEKGSKKGHTKENETINNLFIYGLKNRLFFINSFTPITNTMEDVIILEQDERQNITKKIVANKGIYRDGLWRFYQCLTYNFYENGMLKGDPQYNEEEIMDITETPQEFLTQRQHPDYMTISQLEDYIWRLSKSQATTVVRNFKVDLYQRFTKPLTSFIIVLLGIPFSLIMRRRATGLSSVGISLMLGFFYYVSNAICLALGKAGVLFPLLAATLSHIIALTTALYLIASLP